MAKDTAAIATGAATGAASGAAVGSVGGPPGIIAGAVIGGVLGGAAAEQGAEGARKAAKEQDERRRKALEEAKKLQSTTESTTTQDTTQTQDSTSFGSTETVFQPKSALEQALQDKQIADLEKQRELVNQQQQTISERQGLQESARTGLGDILGGGAFELSGAEEARIDRLREANIASGRGAVDELLNERLAQLEADAASRGVRGQAFSQLQTGALGEAARSLDRQTLEANRIAAQQAIELPGQRTGLQANVAGQFAGFADAATQQAIQNQQLLQDPVALQQIREERLKGGKTVQIGDQSSTSGTSTVGTNQAVATGEGAAGILAAQANAPGQTAAGIAGGLGAVGAFGQAAGGVGQLAGGAAALQAANRQPAATQTNPQPVGGGGVSPALRDPNL